MKKAVDNGNHRQLSVNVHEHQDEGNIEESSTSVHCDEELYKLSRSEGGKESVLLCNNAKCRLLKDHSGFTSGNINSIKQTDVRSGISYYKMECSMCQQEWYVDCIASVRRVELRKLKLEVSERQKKSNQLAPIDDYAPDDYGGSDMCVDNDDEGETSISLSTSRGQDEDMNISPPSAVDELCARINQSLEIKVHLKKSSTFGNDASSSFFCAEQDESEGGKNLLSGRLSIKTMIPNFKEARC